jgi:hypothetical protein
MTTESRSSENMPDQPNVDSHTSGGVTTLETTDSL